MQTQILDEFKHNISLRIFKNVKKCEFKHKLRKSVYISVYCEFKIFSII